MAPIFPGDRRFDHARGRPVKVTGDIVFRPFCEVRIRRHARGIEFLGAPFGRNFEQERGLRVDRVYLLEIARVTPVPSVRTSKMVT